MGGSHESPFKMTGFPTISGTSPAKQKEIEVREGPEYKNPKGESQADIVDKRNKATTTYVKKVEDYSKKQGGLTKEEHAKATKKLQGLQKLTHASMDSIQRVNTRIDIEKASKRKEDAGDLFD